MIELNELQKRRTISKLQNHLGSLVDRDIALLGLAFKPHTDAIREATSVVLAAPLQSERDVRAYDPVAAGACCGDAQRTRICTSALQALDGPTPPC